MQKQWNLTYERMEILSYWILGASLAVSFVTSCTWFFFVGLGLLIGLGSAWSWQRTRDFRIYAEQNKFSFLGDSPGRPMSIEGTPLSEERGQISNCISGRIQNVEMAIFDFSFRRGKATVRQTVVGFRRQPSQTSGWTDANLVGVYHIERSGDWILGYVPRRVVEAEELNEWCESLLNLFQRSGRGNHPEEGATLNLFRLYTEIS